MAFLALLRQRQVATRSASGRLAPCPCHFVCYLKSQKSLRATNMIGHSEADMPLGPVLCRRPALMSYVTTIFNGRRDSIVDLFVSRNCTICSQVAVRFTSLLSHMELRLARAFVGGSVWQLTMRSFTVVSR